MKIPKIFHQVWLGSRDLPTLFQTYQKTWFKYHPAWELMLWDEKNIKNLEFFQESDFVKLSNYSEKSDYLRFCIILEFGGIYMDTDFEALKCIEPLVGNAEFFIGYDSPDERGIRFTNSAIFGAVKKHPLTERIFKSFPRQIDYGKRLDSVMKIGPGYITPIIEDYHEGKISIFEPEYLYPEEQKDSIGKTDDNRIKIDNRAFAIHHYQFSWLPWYKKCLRFFSQHKRYRKYYLWARNNYRKIKGFIFFKI